MKSFKEAAVKVPMGKFKELAKTIAVGTIEKSPEKKVMGFLQAMGKKVRLERDPNSRSGFRVVVEKSVSKSQQRFMGMVRAVQKGDMKAPSPEVAKAAKSMKKKDVKDFASTKHKGLPEMKTFREMREGAMSKDKEKHDTGGFRISNADAKAARDRLAAKRKQKAQKSASQNKSFNNVRSRMEDNIDETSWKKEGPWKKIKPGERKDKYGNTVKDKNVPRNLARSAMKKTAAGETDK